MTTDNHRGSQLEFLGTKNHMKQGLALFKRGEYRLAVEQFELIIRHDKDYVRAYNNLGYIYRKLGDYDKALEVWEAGLKVDPSYRRVQRNITSLRRFLKNRKDKPETAPIAIEDFEAGIEWLSENAELAEILEGRFFDVYLLEDGGSKWALKTPGRKLPSGTDLFLGFEQACSRWLRLLPNPYVVRARSLEWVSERPFLVMEYTPEGSLRTLMAEGPLSLAQLLEFSVQTCLGMQSIHIETGSAHGDLRPENLLLFKPASGRGERLEAKSNHCFLKVSDPGVAALFARRDSVCDSAGRILPALADEGLVRTPSGFVTPFVYSCAPELLDSLQTPTVSSDVFSFGVVLYEMLTGMLPFSGPRSTDASHGVRPEHPSFINARIPLDLGNIAMRCLEREVASRPRDFVEIGLAVVQCMAGLQLSLSELHGLLGRYKKISKFQYLDEKKNAPVMIVAGTESSSEVGQVWEVLKQSARRDNDYPLQQRLAGIEKALSASGLSVGEIYMTRESLFDALTAISPERYLEQLNSIPRNEAADFAGASAPASDARRSDGDKSDADGAALVEQYRSLVQAGDELGAANSLVEALRLRARTVLKESPRGGELATSLDSLATEELFARQLADLFREHHAVCKCPAPEEFLKETTTSSKESVILIAGLMFMGRAEYSAALEIFNMLPEERYLPALDIYLWTLAKFRSEKMNVLRTNSLRNANGLLKEMLVAEDVEGEIDTVASVRQSRQHALDGYFLRGLVLEQMGEHKQAVAHFRAWKRAAKTRGILSTARLAWCNLFQGKSMYDVGMPSEALLRWQRIISFELEPPFFNFLELGTDKPRVMLAAYVLHCCDAALARMPENSVLWCIKSKLLNCLARNDEALECADRAAKVGEDFYPAQYARMEALLAMGKFEEAYAALNAYAMREPYEPLVMLKQAEILCRLQAPEKAIQELNRAIAYGLDLSDLRASVNKKRLTILERMDEFKGIASYLSGTD